MRVGEEFPPVRLPHPPPSDTVSGANEERDMTMKIEDTTFRQCWAYNAKGQRCEHPAAHPGNHVVSSEWTDSECVAPTAVTVTPPVITATTGSTVTVTTPDAANCVACGHKHKAGECKCGCHTFIG